MSDLTKERAKGELTVKDITSLHAEVRPKDAAPRAILKDKSSARDEDVKLSSVVVAED